MVARGGARVSDSKVHPKGGPELPTDEEAPPPQLESGDAPGARVCEVENGRGALDRASEGQHPACGGTLVTASREEPCVEPKHARLRPIGR